MQFEIKRSGFPINIGEIEFFFGTTVEELTRFFDVQDELEDKIAPLMKKREKLVIDQENMTKSDAESLIEISNELNAIQYDALLGEGSYEKSIRNIKMQFNCSIYLIQSLRTLLKQLKTMQKIVKTN